MNTMNQSILTDILDLKMIIISMKDLIEIDLIVIEECIMKAQFKINIIKKLITKNLSIIDRTVMYMQNQLWIEPLEVYLLENIITTH